MALHDMILSDSHGKVGITSQCTAHIAMHSTQDHTHMHVLASYGVATMSRRLKIIGFFCRISSLL